MRHDIHCDSGLYSPNRAIRDLELFCKGIKKRFGAQDPESQRCDPAI